jgi:hypothetical protein
MFNGYNTFIQIFGEIQFQRQTAAKRCQARRQRAVTSRARAPRVAGQRRPTLDGHAPHTFPTTPLPEVVRHPRPTPPDARLCPRRPRAVSPRRRTRAVRAADPRSVHGAGRTCAGRGAVARQMLSRHHPPSPELACI